eukprot:TRINITY_DN19467_c0_g1_i1.p1 TRINITY_DN19467_c0_g1~~TRINITY_DN19467_c0_g1_i1.p1  ORF type:complete len:834 (+),score=264.68 TRINITY_DN19467_c0_g1_i1:192-2693(+)
MEVISQTMELIFETVEPLLGEILFAIFFALNYTYIRGRMSAPKGKKAGKKQHGEGRFCAAFSSTIEERFQAGEHDAVVSMWRSRKSEEATPVDALRYVVRSLFAQKTPASQDDTLREIVEHMKSHAQELANDKAAAFVLEAVSRCTQGASLILKAWEALKQELSIQETATIRESFYISYAFHGEEDAAESMMEKMKAAGQTLTVRGHINAIRGFITSGLAEPAMNEIIDMVDKGYKSQPALTIDLVRCAIAKGRSCELVERTRKIVPLPVDALAALLEDCLNRSDLKLAVLVEQVAVESKTVLNISCYDSLLKLYADAGDARAINRFEEMQSLGLRMSDGLCVGLVARCAAPRFREFAEALVSSRRAKGGLTLNMYSALMKVYAFDRQFDKAMASYEELLAEGLEPDSVMCGSLIRFAVDCQRTDVLPQLVDRLPTVDPQHFMLLIRSCAHTKDTARAFQFFEKLKLCGQPIDARIYNTLLDVCASTGAMDRAMKLLKEMQDEGVADEVSFNIIMKGYCGGGADADKVSAVLKSMEEAGLKPTATTYNCLINADISAGRMDKAWEKVEIMAAKQVPMDSYTFATLLKSLKNAEENGGKRSTARADLERALTLLDKSGLEACGDEVLFVTVVEACMRQRHLARVGEYLKKFDGCPLARQAKIHTRGIVIKAHGMLGQVDKCREMWRSIGERELTSVVIGCMLNALVTNRCTSEAEALMRELEARNVQTNAIMYSTLLKGFVQQDDAERVFELINEMRIKRLSISPSSYQVAVDCLVKNGHQDRVEILRKGNDSPPNQSSSKSPTSDNWRAPARDFSHLRTTAASSATRAPWRKV